VCGWVSWWEEWRGHIVQANARKTMSMALMSPTHDSIATHKDTTHASLAAVVGVHVS